MTEKGSPLAGGAAQGATTGMISRYYHIRTLLEKARDRLQAAFNKIERDALLWLLERLEVRIVGAPDKSCHEAADCIIALRDFMKEMSDGTRPS